MQGLISRPVAVKILILLIAINLEMYSLFKTRSEDSLFPSLVTRIDTKVQKHGGERSPRN